MDDSRSALLEAAEQAARSAGRVVEESRGAPGKTEVKGSGDYVTDVDLAAEKAARQVLEASDSSIPVLGEEGGGRAAERYWLIDPVDGTTNFIHGYHVVGVSVALIESGSPVIAAVHAPFLDQTFVGARGDGAYRVTPSGRQRLAVAGRPVSQAIVATGFTFRDKRQIERHLDAVRLCLNAFEDLRRPGAASLDLAWVAAGIFDGFFELGLASWDVAAGALLVEEAGGIVSDWSGSGDYLSGDILAGPPHVHEELVRIAKETSG